MHKPRWGNVLFFLGGAVLFSILVVLGYITLIVMPDVNERYTIVFATNPVGILTINTTDHTGTLFLIPDSIAIESAHDKGRYPIGSLWKMGSLDVRDRSLLSESVGVALGIPIDGYIGSTYESLNDSQNPLETVRSFLSFPYIASALLSRNKTNISPKTLFHISRSFSILKTHDIRILNAENMMATYDEQLADETVRKVLDSQKIDVMLKNMFTVSSVRKEALSVGLLNTTSVPFLAGKIAREFTNSGIYVVSVDNEDSALKTCQLVGTKNMLSSGTAHFIVKKFGCTPLVSDVPAREDLIVRLGTGNTDRFIPRIK